jgi:hypothetical protein
MRSTRRFVAIVLVAVLALTQAAHAAWDKSKPQAGPNSAAVSADIRNNWAAIETAVGGVNLLADPTFIIWPSGDTTAPAHWVLAGASSTIARTGTGLGDTQRKVGLYAAKVTAGGGAVATLLQNLLPTTAYDDGFDNVPVSMGAWVRGTAASKCRLEITDGATTSFSAFHTGGSTFEWLTISGHTISASATKLAAGLEVAISATCHISGPTFIIGQVPPAQYMPAPIVDREIKSFMAGNATTGTFKIGLHYFFARPAYVRAAWLMAQTTAPTGAALIVDINHYDGAAAQSMFATRPQLGIGVSFGTRQATDSATYRWRCFKAYPDASTDGMLTIDVDQIGSTAPGTDIYIMIEFMEYARPLEAFLAPSDVN